MILTFPTHTHGCLAFELIFSPCRMCFYLFIYSCVFCFSLAWNARLLSRGGRRSLSGERWVWGSERSGRQIDRDEISVPAFSFAAPHLPRSLSDSFSPSSSSSFLASSASSLNPLRSPVPSASSSGTAVAREASSDNTAQATAVVSSPLRVQLSQPSPSLQEPPSFRPLPIDISKLPLETTSDSSSSSLDDFRHPPIAPEQNQLAQDLSEDAASLASFGQQASFSSFFNTQLTQPTLDFSRVVPFVPFERTKVSKRCSFSRIMCVCLF